MTAPSPLAQLAAVFAEVERELAPIPDLDSVLRALTAIAVREIPAAEHAGITRGSNRNFKTVAPTSDLVVKADQIQYSLRSGPCVDAVTTSKTFYAADLRTDTRWPEFGRRAFEIAGVISMLSFRLYVEDYQDQAAGLNLYSTSADAFDERSQSIALLLATHGALAVSGAVARGHAQNLKQALKTSRDIGVAVGITMMLHKVTRDQAFDLLRIASFGLPRVLASPVAGGGACPQVSSSRLP